MASFIVMGNAEAEEDVAFVRDGFAVFAFAAPLLWLLWHRLWLHAATYFALSGLLAAFVFWRGDPMAAVMAAFVSLGANLLIALEGGDWLRQRHEQIGDKPLELIDAKSVRQASEFFASSMIKTTVRKPRTGFVPLSDVSLIPLNGSR